MSLMKQFRAMPQKRPFHIDPTWTGRGRQTVSNKRKQKNLAKVQKQIDDTLAGKIKPLYLDRHGRVIHRG